MTPTLAMVVAIGLTSALCYAPSVRADRRPNRRRSSADSTSVDSDGGVQLQSGRRSRKLVSNTSPDVMGNPIDGGGDSGDGGGGDGGGGD